MPGGKKRRRREAEGPRGGGSSGAGGAGWPSELESPLDGAWGDESHERGSAQDDWTGVVVPDYNTNYVSKLGLKIVASPAPGSRPQSPSSANG